MGRGWYLKKRAWWMMLFSSITLRRSLCSCSIRRFWDSAACTFPSSRYLGDRRITIVRSCRGSVTFPTSIHNERQGLSYILTHAHTAGLWRMCLV